MALPSIGNPVSFVVVLVFGLGVTYFVSSILKLRAQVIGIEAKKREAALALIVFIIVILVVVGFHEFYNSIWVRRTLTQDPLYVLRESLWLGATVLPVVAAFKLTRQRLSTVGISRTNLAKNVAFGFLVSAIFIPIIGFMAPFIGGSFIGISVSIGYSLLTLTVTGFCEETVFRGYIQTRLTAYGGALMGISLTTVLFVVFQFPIGYFCLGDIPLAALYALWRISTGLVLGYMYHKSQSIVAPGIFHSLVVWVALLWSLYF